MTTKHAAMPVSLQEAILSLLAFDGPHGAAVAVQVNADHFDGLFRDAAQAILGYRKKYGKPPGRQHLIGLLDRLTGGGRGQLTKRMLETLAASEGRLNVEYVASRAHGFVRGQIIKAALYEATDRYVAGEDEAMVPDVEQILYAALRSRQDTLDAGTFLSDKKRALAFLIDQPSPVPLGIPLLDQFGVGILPKELLLYIAGKGTGKSWFAVNCGRSALNHKLRVVHITLEMSEARVVQRYYQSFFAIAHKPDAFWRATLESDSLGRFTRFKKEMETPELNFKHPKIEGQLRHFMDMWGTRFDHLVVKEFATSSLTMGALYGYLDFLEMTHKFIPDVLIVDYPDLMQIKRDNKRIELGGLYEELRGLAVRRNMCVIAPTQGNRLSLKAKTVGGHMVSEDVTKINTADNVLTYSQSEGERKMGLARLHIEHARNVETGLTVILAQSYATGQYCRDAKLLNENYWTQLGVEVEA